MVAELQSIAGTRSSRTVRYDDPMIIGAGALVLGYVIGSGRWNWLGRGLTQVAGSLGAFAVNYLVDSFQHHNPQFFNETKVG